MNQSLHGFALLPAFRTLLLVVAGGLVAASDGVLIGAVLWFAVRILLHYRDHPALGISALATLGITFVQVFPGIAAYMSRIVLHVATGALTMAAGVIATIEVCRNVGPQHCLAQHQGLSVTS
jgi:hypothetical protein